MIREKYGTNEEALKKLDRESERYHHVNKGDPWWMKLLKRLGLSIGVLAGGLLLSVVFVAVLVPVVVYVIVCLCIGKGDNMRVNPFFWMKKAKAGGVSNMKAGK